MKTIISYASALELANIAKFVNARVEDIVYDTASSEYDPSRTFTKYVRYIRFTKLVFKNEELLHSIEEINSEAAVGLIYESSNKTAAFSTILTEEK